MQHQPKFVENLIALRDHYQALLEECSRLSDRVREQLTHVNALLVDQLVHQNFVESLMALREHYQSLLEKYLRNKTHAQEQLTHVNALLLDQLVVPYNQQPLSIQASTVNQNENLALPGTANIAYSESLKQSDEASEQDEPDESKQSITPSPENQVLFEATPKDNVEPLHTTEEDRDTTNDLKELDVTSQETYLEEFTEGAATEETEALSMQPLPTYPEEAQQPIALDSQTSSSNKNGFNSTNRKQPVSSKRRLASKTGNTKVDVLPQYRGLPKEEVITQLLQSNAGTILHIDYVVRALYGDLNNSAFRLAKDRVANTLYRGQQKKLWAKVPGQPGCFTLDLKLADSGLT